MHFLRAGRGAPPLVFVHGFCCEIADWVFQIQSLQKQFDVIACDLRGHGKTPGRPEECSIEHYGGDVAALVGVLDLEKPVLIGHSMGCRVVLEANRLLDGRAGGLVLIDGSRLAAGDPGAAERSAREAIERAGFAAFGASLFQQMFFSRSALADSILERVAARPAEIGAALWPRMARWDAGEMDAALAAVRCPVLVIQSTTRDPTTLRRVALQPRQSSPSLDLLKERIKNAKIEVLPGTGHFAQLEAPERVNALIGEFAAAI